MSIQLVFGTSTATVALHGAHVTSYATNGVERLFTSSKSSLTGPAAIRGGIPLCWPCFGPPSPTSPAANLKQHGFARTSLWRCAGQTSDATGAQAVFNLEPSAETRALFKPDWRLVYTVRLLSGSLRTTLRAEAPSSASSSTSTELLSFTAALHTYIKLPHTVRPAQVTVSPLQGLKFIDKVVGGEHVETREAVNIDGPCGEIDRVYLGTVDVLEMNLGGGARAKVTKSNFPDTVLWNPGEAKATGMADMEDGGEARFFCLEPVVTGTPVVLQPGESWEGIAEFSFSD